VNEEKLRVYHFVPERFGILDLINRRIKIARIADLNDPFEFLPACPTAAGRKIIRDFKRRAHESIGLICFSKGRRNPVLWSHYADGHKGLCFGFDVPKAHVKKVKYSATRTVADMPSIFAGMESGEAEIRRWLGTKYNHWSYEQELRTEVILKDDERHADGNWYQDFSPDLRLAEVIVGERCKLTRLSVNNALGELAPHVELWKARLAFGKRYEAVRQHSRKMWP
jgi:hypothetical protein